jgi:dolichyl-phosphate-mannose--protein O-mannosyl transferase
VAYAGLALVVAAFVFFYPTWTGLPLTSADHQMRIWEGDWQ